MYQSGAPLRVGIDARSLGSRKGGDETYLSNVTRALARVDPETDYLLFTSPGTTAVELPGAERIRRVMVSPRTLQVRIPLSLPLAVARHSVDVLHAEYLAPPYCPAPVVVSIHDISWERYPQFFPERDVLQFRAYIPLVMRRASAIFTLSEYSKQDMIRRYCVAAEKVIVAPCAVDEGFTAIREQAQLTAVKERYGTGERYVLCVGNLQPRKNLGTLIDAYVRLRKAGAIGHKLVLVGKEGRRTDTSFAAAHASGFEDDMVFTGYVPDHDLRALYSAADLFVYPSIFEGFGLPPLEAMACGTPVVTSNTSSFPEVVGDAGLMVEPMDAEALAQAIARALSDQPLRKQMIERGLRRVQLFSWDATARTIAAGYRRVARAGRAGIGEPVTS